MTLTSAPAQMPPPINSLAEAEARTANLSDKHGFLLSSDKNTCLFYRYWPAQQGVASDRVVVVLHGIGYHSGPYKILANELNP
jgi:alpha-beta hydrolase superfamily lysophospholipase